MSRWPVVPLGQLCKQDRRGIDGTCESARAMTYLSLEHVEAGTGLILHVPESTPEDKGLSQTFLFDERHVLYGKLRPYLNKVALPIFSGRCTTEIIPFLPTDQVDRVFLAYAFRRQAVVEAAMGQRTGSRMPRADLRVVLAVPTPQPPIAEQRRIAAEIEAKRTEMTVMRSALARQLVQLRSTKEKLLDSLFDPGSYALVRLESVLVQQTAGIGPGWDKYPVYGATRQGLASAKERVGKHGIRYKPVLENTIFYNPMRILLGSIAMLPPGGVPGITSPDYVVLKTRSELLTPLAFYEWFRGPHGQKMILDLARGAVRERILFSRLKEGAIALPPIEEQNKVALALEQANHAIQTIQEQLAALDAFDQTVLREVFA